MTGFAELVAARGTALLRTAYLTCGSVHEAEDVPQAALEKACRNWSRIDDRDPEPYVRRIIVNTVISRARRPRPWPACAPCWARRRPVLDDLKAAMTAETADLAIPPDLAERVERRVRRRRWRSRLAALLIPPLAAAGVREPDLAITVAVMGEVRLETVVAGLDYWRASPKSLPSRVTPSARSSSPRA